jgi:hypothetical protein
LTTAVCITDNTDGLGLVSDIQVNAGVSLAERCAVDWRWWLPPVTLALLAAARRAGW